MSAIQAEAIEVKDPAAEATRIVAKIPVGEGIILESPMGDQLGLWRHAEDSIELVFRGNTLTGNRFLATRAVARYLRASMARVHALDVVARAVESALGVKIVTPGMAQVPSAGGMVN